MRSIRVVGVGKSYYHCISRVVDRRIVFRAGEKEVFRSILRKLEDFCDVRVVTYCLMGNHFHLLLEIPEEESLEPLTSAEWLERLPLLYDRATVAMVADELERASRAGDTHGEKTILDRYERRRGHLSIFLKELKQRVSIFMNRRLGRVGTLWEGRFKSVLVDGGGNALLTVAAYIDLNPVRAGLVQRPEDYRWSGYGEAVGGSRQAKRARRGLALVQREGLENPGSPCDWQETLGRYRRLLYTDGVEQKADESSGAVSRRGISAKESERVLASETKMSLPEVLRLRVRYFSDGAVIGSSAFVEGAFERLREKGRVGPKRESGARRLRGAEWGELRVLRDLQVKVISPPE